MRRMLIVIRPEAGEEHQVFNRTHQMFFHGGLDDTNLNFEYVSEWPNKNFLLCRNAFSEGEECGN